MKLKDQTELTGKQKFYIFLLIFVIMATLGYGILRADYNEPKEELLVPLSYSASHFYPSDAIFGFIEGCWQQMELSQALPNFWPSEIKVICGCVIDSLRMSVSWPDFRDNWGSIPLDSTRSQIAKGYTTECTRRALIFKDLQKEQQQGSQK